MVHFLFSCISDPIHVGRKVVVEMHDIWNNLLATWTKPGYYYLNRPGVAVARIVVEIDVNASDEQDYMMALNLQDDISITDLTVGGNEYEGRLELIAPVVPIMPEDVAGLSAKEFFAIASVIVRYNPPRDTRIANAIKYTKLATALELEEARHAALKKMGID